MLALYASTRLRLIEHGSRPRRIELAVNERQRVRLVDPPPDEPIVHITRRTREGARQFRASGTRAASCGASSGRSARRSCTSPARCRRWSTRFGGMRQGDRGSASGKRRNGGMRECNKDHEAADGGQADACEADAVPHEPHWPPRRARANMRGAVAAVPAGCVRGLGGIQGRPSARAFIHSSTASRT
jgi:hypothetical protein